jgi:hypothetical protein
VYLIAELICAEEEAATSLLLSVKSQGYPRSGEINERSHPNKAGVIVFISGVVDWYRDRVDVEDFPFEFPPILRTTSEPGRQAIEVVLPLRGMERAVHPRPPLHLVTEGNQTLQDMIGEAVRVKMKKKVVQEVRGAIEVKANLRNSFLYASDKSLPPAIKNTEDFLVNQASIVSALLIAVGLIDPWRPPKYPLSRIVESSVSEFVRVMSSVRRLSKKAKYNFEGS